MYDTIFILSSFTFKNMNALISKEPAGHLDGEGLHDDVVDEEIAAGG